MIFDKSVSLIKFKKKHEIDKKAIVFFIDTILKSGIFDNYFILRLRDVIWDH